MTAAFARRLAFVALLLFAALADKPARAQFRFQMKDVETTVDATEVEVGDVVHVSLQVMSEAGTPERPELGAHPGFSVRGPNVSSSQMVMNINGHSSVRRGITATWTLTAGQLGRFTIGPPSAFVAGARVTSNAVKVRVLSKGSIQHGADPFDPFAGPSTLDPWKSFFGDDAHRREPPKPDPQYALDHDDTAPVFAHATVDKTAAVVGEQVTFTVMLYVDPGIDDQDFITEHEAPAASFVRRTLMADDAKSKALGYGKVRDRVYRVKQVRKIALFPVSTGNLEIGSEELRYPVGNRYVAAKTELQTVNVTEPPTRGRPPGYALGDTGHFDLRAEVLPRQVDQGDAVSVTVDLQGTGNLPRVALPLPLQQDVSFMTPEVTEKLAVYDKDRFGATDTFRYVVRIDREGDVNLGTIELPYFDPDKKAYAVARANLGVVHVNKTAAEKPAPADPNPVTFPDVPPPKDKLEGPRATKRHLADAPWYWALLFGSPLAFAVVRSGAWASSRLRHRAKTRAEDPKRLMNEQRDAASRAENSGDAKALVGVVRKYVEAQAIAFADINVRSEPAESVAELLGEHGVTEDSAKELGAILAACAALAFRPDDAPAAEVSLLFDRAKKLESKLDRESRT